MLKIVSCIVLLAILLTPSQGFQWRASLIASSTSKLAATVTNVNPLPNAKPMPNEFDPLHEALPTISV